MTRITFSLKSLVDLYWITNLLEIARAVNQLSVPCISLKTIQWSWIKPYWDFPWYNRKCDQHTLVLFRTQHVAPLPLFYCINDPKMLLNQRLCASFHYPFIHRPLLPHWNHLGRLQLRARQFIHRPYPNLIGCPKHCQSRSLSCHSSVSLRWSSYYPIKKKIIKS